MLDLPAVACISINNLTFFLIFTFFKSEKTIVPIVFLFYFFIIKNVILLLFKPRLKQNAGETDSSSFSNLNLKEAARVITHLFDWAIYYLSRQAVKQSDLCPRWSAWSSRVRLSQVTVISGCSLRAAERSMHQCTAQDICMQSNPQQSKGVRTSSTQ